MRDLIRDGVLATNLENHGTPAFHDRRFQLGDHLVRLGIPCTCVYLSQLIPSRGLDDQGKLRALIYQALVN